MAGTARVAMSRSIAALAQLAAVTLLNAALPGCVPAPSEATPAAGHAEKAQRTIYVVRHGWHTGIVVRHDDIPPRLWPESNDFPAATLLEVGWGDREFYMRVENTTWLALQAAFRSQASVLHVAGLRRPVVEEFPASSVVELRVARQDFERLVQYIHDTHARTDHTPVKPLAAGLYGESRFYPARGHFHLFNTCNVWTARALQAAGLPMQPRLAVTASALIDQAARHGRCLQCSGRNAGRRSDGTPD
jgi:uncharacterized protein (TIGR02117 family)